MARPLVSWVARLTPYGIAALLSWGFSTSGIAETLNLLLYDASTQLRQLPSGRHTPVRLIGITEADIQRYGWPINDRLLAKALERLDQAGTSAIGLDLYRDGPVQPGHDDFTEAIKQNPKLIGIFSLADGISAPPSLPAKQQSFNDLVVDPDGSLRRDLVHVGGQPESHVALPLRLLETSTGESLRGAIESGQWNLAWLHPHAGGYSRLDASGYQQMLPFHRPGSFPTWSLSDLLDGKIANAELKGRIVLVGSTAPSLRDTFHTPFTRFHSGQQLAEMPGVEIHAHRLAALIKAHQGASAGIGVLPTLWEPALLLLVGALGLGLGEGIRSLQRSGWLLLIAEFGLLAAGAALLVGGIWLDIPSLMLTLGFITTAGWLRRGAIGQLQRRQMERLLGQATSPAIAQELWLQRDSLLEKGSFPGRNLQVTVLFADVMGFSTVAEQSTAAETLHWLNQGMQRFVSEVIDSGGMVNKFTGDGFLAVFGVPVPQDPGQSAGQALHCAARLQQAVEELEETLSQQGAPLLKLRVGLHSGDVIAGSMGSSERMEFAVIGDTVNICARLEALEKQRMSSNCRVLLSSETRELLPSTEQVKLLSWGLMPIKGRSQPVAVYELQPPSQRTGNC